ncbi:esterase/lipase family protein [Xanthomonas graminis]|uniref:esterase/lipase family protein n=1 Tax=Xanthomonas graminis TaxID=3390026 RepID=UPI001F43EB62|nr:alpha/beta fold hydrolase [Xanthomonas translucens]UKE72642.1 alpha/beta fold hydrolase [Xanthomonas translucens pv. phleipratensis]
MRAAQALRQLAARALMAVGLLAGSGCAMVTVQSRAAGDYIATKRGDVLSTGELSDASQETLRVVAIERKPCEADIPACAAQLRTVQGLDEERRLAALSELWLRAATLRTPKRTVALDDAALQAWMETARYAYAYLFHTERPASARAFEDRQTQVRDYYNYAVQHVVGALFERWRARSASGELRDDDTLPAAGWQVRAQLDSFRLPGGVARPNAMVPAASLRFDGLRSTYRRDGFGAELVAEVSPAQVGDPTAIAATAKPGQAATDTAGYSELSYAPTTVLLRFDGDSLAQVLDTRSVVIAPYDPYRDNEVVVHGQRLPLAANFTAAYGLWLARSGFARQSLRSMLGRRYGIEQPHLYLMQPYDPNRRIVLMLHGLGSSPEAWVNVANEIMGDEQLRRHYQIWQVYYPTNMPIAWNRAQIETLLQQTLHDFDPQGQAPASRHMVLIGHSMGGVIARLLVSNSGERIWNDLLAGRDLSGERGARIRERLQPLLRFAPLPQVDRAIFIAAPHRGTAFAEGRIGRLVGGLIRLPTALLARFTEVMRDIAGDDSVPQRPPNGIDNLRDTDPFVRVAAELPISPAVRYNSIIARRNPALPLADADDGLVPYRSAHLQGAESELVITSGHSVQETPQAILEIRRILHAQIASE